CNLDPQLFTPSTAYIVLLPGPNAASIRGTHVRIAGLPSAAFFTNSVASPSVLQVSGDPFSSTGGDLAFTNCETALAAPLVLYTVTLVRIAATPTNVALDASGGVVACPPATPLTAVSGTRSFAAPAQPPPATGRRCERPLADAISGVVVRARQQRALSALQHLDSGVLRHAIESAFDRVRVASAVVHPTGYPGLRHHVLLARRNRVLARPDRVEPGVVVPHARREPSVRRLGHEATSPRPVFRGQRCEPDRLFGTVRVRAVRRGRPEDPRLSEPYEPDPGR